MTPSKNINKNNRKNTKDEDNIKIPESEQNYNEIDKSQVSNSSLVDDKTFQVIRNDDDNCASSDNEASLSIDTFQPNQVGGSVSSEKIHTELSTLPDVVDCKGKQLLKFSIVLNIQYIVFLSWYFFQL